VPAPRPSPASAPAATSRTLAEILEGKKAKLRHLRSEGVDPYPARCRRTHSLSQALEIAAPLKAGEHDSATIAAVGRIVALRDMGGSAFAHLEDSSARCQAYFRKDAMPTEAFALLKKGVDLGDFVAVTGTVFRTKTGEPTIAVSGISILSKSLRPLPEKWHGLKDVETRYRLRHLDLISNREVRSDFEKRSVIIKTVRSTLDSAGFLEVETPILLPQAGGASARPFCTHHHALKKDMVLRIATELYLKRLIVGGFEKVYEIGRIFRNEGIDTKHNPEFTMLEAYQAYADYNDMADLFERVVGNCAQALGISQVAENGRIVDLRPPFPRVRLPELWRKLLGEPIDAVLNGLRFNATALRQLADRLGLGAVDGLPNAKIFERIVDSKILPAIDREAKPVLLFDHPAAITPLAKLIPGSSTLVERFEAFAFSQELANAYSELNDPLDQRERFAEQARRRREEREEEAELLDEDFVEALECGMPPTGGIGIGIDRLVMLLAGRASIRDVILFPILKDAA
jgi:lysyl-tRNA synthetase class 2